jgi:hypothetical protein
MLVLATSAAAVAIPGQPAAALPAYQCSRVTGGTTAVHSHITDVRVGRHSKFDRFVIEFSTRRLPHYVVPRAHSGTTFILPSGRHVKLLGKARISVNMHYVTGVGTYHGRADFRPRFPQLREARRIEDFEGYVMWGLGLAHRSCKRVFKLTEPTRLVIDVPH